MIFVRRRRLPFLPLLLGLVVVMAGFAYDVIFVSIPFQDPPPALQRRYEHDARVASKLISLGGYLVVLGIIVLGAIWLVRRLRRQPSD